MSDNAADARIDQRTVSTGSGIFGGSGTQEERAQEFTSHATQTHITALQLMLRKAVAPTDNVTIKITASLGGSALATATVAAADLSTTNSWVTVPIDLTVTASTTYFIEVSRSGSRDATNYPVWERGGIYSGGTPRIKESGSWSADGTTTDFGFSIYYGGWIDVNAAGTLPYTVVSDVPDSNTAVACSITVRSDGDIIIIYQGAQIADMGQVWDTIKYARWENYAAGWVIDQAVDGAADEEWRNPVIVHNPDNDKSHFFYRQDVAFDHFHKALTSGNSLDGTPDTIEVAGQSADYPNGPGAWYNPADSVASRVTLAYTADAGSDFSAVKIDDDGTPSTAQTVNDSDAVKLDGETYMNGISHQGDDVVVAWWANSVDSDLYISTSDDGAAWAAESNEWTATINALSCSVLINDSGDTVLAIVADDGGTIKYHEIVPVAAGGTTHQLAGTIEADATVTGGTGEPAIDVQLAGAVNAAATVTAATAEPAIDIPLAGAVNVAVTTTGDLTRIAGVTPLAGDVVVAATVSTVAGEPAVDVQLVGDVTAAVAVSTVAGEPAVDVQLAGDVSAAAVASSTANEPAVDVQLVGAVNASAILAATDFDRTIGLAGDVAASATVTASANEPAIDVQLAGAIAASAVASSAANEPTVDIQAAGAPTVLATVVGDLTVDFDLAAEAVNATATVAGVLGVKKLMAGAINATVVATAGANEPAIAIDLEGAVTFAAVATAGANEPAIAVDLAGAVAAAALLAATDFDRTIGLAGAVNATATVTGVPDVDIQMAGTIAAVATASGDVSVAIPLAGDSTLAVTVAGDLTVAHPLAGSIAASAILDAPVLSVLKRLEGVVNASAVATSAANEPTIDVQLVGAPAPTATVTSGGMIFVPAALVGTVAASATVSGVPDVAISLAGAINAAATVSAATIGVKRPLAGSVVVTTTATGDVSVGVKLLGAPTVQATTTGELTVAIDLAGDVNVAVTTTGDLSVDVAVIQLAGDVAASASASAAANEPTVDIQAAGAINASATATGDLSVAIALEGTVTATIAVNGTLANQVALGGSISATSTVSGDVEIDVQLAGSVVSAATVTGDVVIDIQLAGAVSVAATTTGDLQVGGGVDVAGDVSASATVSGDLAVAIDLDGAAINVATTVAGSISLSLPLGGSVLAAATATASANEPAIDIQMLGAPMPSATVTANLSASPWALAGDTGATATVSGPLEALRPIAGTVSVSVSVTGTTLDMTRFIEGAVSAAAVVAGTGSVTLALADSVVANVTVVGIPPIMTIGIAGDVSAAASISAELTVIVFEGYVNAAATVTGNLNALFTAAGEVQAGATVTAPLTRFNYDDFIMSWDPRYPDVIALLDDPNQRTVGYNDNLWRHIFEATRDFFVRQKPGKHEYSDPSRRWDRYYGPTGVRTKR